MQPSRQDSVKKRQRTSAIASVPVRCAGCGREYDRELFGYGRSVHCTCGFRVGVPLRRDLRADPAFFADAMLGRLARWLRALGYDTAFRAEIEDRVLVRRSIEERRVLLTRDRSLPEEWWIDGCLLLQSDDPLEQLRAVALRFGLDCQRALFTRCLVCNAPLESLTREQVRENGLRAQVPLPVLRRTRTFRHCAGCNRVYWEGSHTTRMRRRLERALAR